MKIKAIILSLCLLCVNMTVMPFLQAEESAKPVELKETKLKPTDEVVMEFKLEACIEDWLTFAGHKVPAGLFTVEYLQKNVGGNLYCEGYGVTSLEGLQYATGLTNIYMKDNELTDISQLSTMPNLKKLDISGSNVTDLSPIAEMDELTTLRVSDNNIDNIDVLVGMPRLELLDVSNNNISDASSITSLVRLKHLDIANNQISDVSMFNRLTNLENLYIEGNQISDISSFSNMTKLRNVMISDNEISNIDSLANATNMQFLYGENNQIKDISVMANWLELYETNLNNNQILDPSALGNLPKLHYADVKDQAVYFDAIEMNDRKPYDLGTTTLLDGSKKTLRFHPEYKDGLTYQGRSTGYFSDSIYEAGKRYISHHGRAYQDYVYTNPISSEPMLSVPEDIVLTDEQLIEVFNVKHALGYEIIVDQSTVDYSSPSIGSYSIIFSDGEVGNNEYYASVAVVESKPTIESNDTASIKVGTNNVDYLDLFAVIATDSVTGDLTESVVVDSSAVNLDVVGSYEVIFTVTDKDGHTVSKTVTLVVKEKMTDPDPDPEPTDPEPTDPEPTDPEPTDPEPTDPEPTDPEPTDPEVKKPDSTEKETDVKGTDVKGTDTKGNVTVTKALSKTGSTLVVVLISLGAILLVLFGIKRKLKTN